MRREIIIENKIIHEKERALLKVIDGEIYFISNISEYNGAPISPLYKEGFKYSWILLSLKKSLQKYKNFKEFDKDMGSFFGDNLKYNFTFANENKNNFREIIL